MKHAIYYKRLFSAVLLFSMLVVTSCSKFIRDFDLKGKMDPENIIYLNTIVNPAETKTRIRAGIAQSLSSETSGVMGKLDLKMTLNGETVALVEDKETETQYLNERFYLVDRKIKAGDRIRLTASAPKTRSVQAEAQVISSLPAFQVEMKEVMSDKFPSWMKRNEGELNHCLEFKVVLDEAPDSHNFYAVQVVKCVELSNAGESELDPEEYGTEDFDSIFYWAKTDGYSTGRYREIVTQYNGGDMQIFDTHSVEDGKVVLKTAVAYDEQKTVEGKAVLTPRYKLIVSRISPELYYYVEKENRSMDVLFSIMGLNTMNQAFTNVIGGSGVVASKNDVDSRWMYNRK